MGSSSIPRFAPIFVILAVLMAIISTGCSGGKNIASPELEASYGSPPGSLADNGRVMWAVFDFLIDPDTLDVQILSPREASPHYNVTSFLLPPNCSDCVKISVIGVDFIQHIYSIKVILRNPTLLDGYDVRGTIRFFSFDKRELMNPDDYTKVFDDSMPPDINPFKAFAKTEPKRKFASGASWSEQFDIRFPPPPNFLVNYVVDASWPSNQKEPYEITDQSADGELDELGMNEVTVSCNVRDWQNDVEYVRLDLTPLGFPAEVDMSHGASNYYYLSISNDYAALPGDYKCLISAKSYENTWLLYDYVTLTVSATPQGPPVWVDTIGITGADPADTQVTVTYGVAVDPDIPVHYNIYWSETTPINFATADMVEDFNGSPYIVGSLINGHTYHFAVRAEDALGYEDNNTVELPAMPGINPHAQWSYKTTGIINSSPAFCDLNGDLVDDVIIGSEDAHVYCLSGVDGSVIWSFPTGDWVDSSPAIAVEGMMPQIPDVIVGSYDYNVYRIKGDAGTEVWHFPTGGVVHASPALADVNSDDYLDVIIGSFDHYLYAINGVTGEQIWSYDAGGPIYSSAALGDITGDSIPDCFVGSRDNSLHVINGATGEGLWTFPTGDWVNSSPALCDFNGDEVLDVAVTSLDNNLYVIDGATHDQIFNFPTGDKCWTSPAIGYIDGDFIPDVVFGSDDFKLYAVSGIDGSEIWSFSSGDRIFSSAALADLTGDSTVDAIVGSDDSKLYLVDGITGKSAWEIETGNWIDSSPCVGDPDYDGIAEIAVGSFDGYVYLISSDIQYPMPELVPWPKFHRDLLMTGLFLLY